MGQVQTKITQLQDQWNQPEYFRGDDCIDDVNAEKELDSRYTIAQELGLPVDYTGAMVDGKYVKRLTVIAGGTGFIYQIRPHDETLRRRTDKRCLESTHRAHFLMHVRDHIPTQTTHCRCYGCRRVVLGRHNETLMRGRYLDARNNEDFFNLMETSFLGVRARRLITCDSERCVIEWRGIDIRAAMVKRSELQSMIDDCTAALKE